MNDSTPHDTPAPISPDETLMRFHRSCLIARDDARLVFYTPGLSPSVRLIANEAYALMLDVLHHSEMAVNLQALEEREVTR